MTTRILPVEEWARLEGTQLGPLRERLDPRWTQILVVETEGRIVGHVACLPIWHLETLWIDPAYQGRVSVARRLWQGVQRWMRGANLAAMLAGSETDAMHRLLTGLGGTPMPETFYRVPNTEPPCRPQ